MLSAGLLYLIFGNLLIRNVLCFSGCVIESRWLSLHGFLEQLQSYAGVAGGSCLKFVFVRGNGAFSGADLPRSTFVRKKPDSYGQVAQNVQVVRKKAVFPEDAESESYVGNAVIRGRRYV